MGAGVSNQIMSPPQVGAAAVDDFAAICARLGYEVERYERERLLPHDLKVNGQRVEVKTRTTDAGYFHLKGRRSCSLVAYRRSDVDVFALRLNGRWHIVPADSLSDGCGDIKNKVSVEKITQYADLWGLLACDGGQLYRQKSLF